MLSRLLLGVDVEDVVLVVVFVVMAVVVVVAVVVVAVVVATVVTEVVDLDAPSKPVTAAPPSYVCG